MRLDVDKLRLECAGKWQGILSNLGIDVGDGSHMACPFCGGKDRARWVYDDQREGLFCNMCDPQFMDGIGVVMRAKGVDFLSAWGIVAPMVGSVEPTRPQGTNGKDYMKELYKISRPLQKADIGWKYLFARGLGSIAIPKLGFCPKCYESETKKEHPAIVATFIGKDGSALNMYRIYLTPDGKKLQISSPKKWLPSNGRKLPGGAIRLYPWVEGPLGIAEGIETALAIAYARTIPVWAATGTALLEAFDPPDGVTQLEIYGDNDANYAGQKAAYTLAHRIKRDRDIVVNVNIPAENGYDWLDVLKNEL